MADEMNMNPARSAEFEIDETVDILIRKLVTSELTREEEARYYQLLAQRAKLMRASRPRRVAA